MIKSIFRWICFWVALFIILFPVIANITRTPWKNNCMQIYVDFCKRTWVCYGTIYNLDWQYHIEHATKWLKLPDTMKVWEAKGCFITADKWYVGMFNTIYCWWTYILTP